MSKTIIMEDDDGGFYIAELDITREIETPDENFVEVYKQKSYHHSLESALREF
jgi:hypothetical protein